MRTNMRGPGERYPGGLPVRPIADHLTGRSLRENGRKPKGKMAGYQVDVIPDPPDLRDRLYEPSLLDLKSKLFPPDGLQILDQGREGACTGFGLAAVINLLNAPRRRAGANELPRSVSPRMLYQMAKLHDEWEGTDYEGSSIRGALKGFFHNGVCSEELAPYNADERNWTLTPKQAEAARLVGLGVYYRLRPNIIDYHTALNETGVIYASARVHTGWIKPEGGVIQPSEVHTGGHAFAIVGYDDLGFLVQNSWGAGWSKLQGRPGLARWPYHDWAANIMDAWVLRLSVPAPEAFALTTSRLSATAVEARPSAPAPRRYEIIGHFAHVDDGRLVDTGRYATPIESIIETVNMLAADAASANRKYDHMLFFGHGGLNTQDDSARRIKTMKEVFKRNRIYPFHFMWATGFTEELLDALVSVFSRSAERVGGFRDLLDTAFEKMSRPVGRAVWRQIKDDAHRSFLPGFGGYQVFDLFQAMNAELTQPFKVHLVGHSAGSILHTWLVDAIRSMGHDGPPIDSLSLMAPACTVDLFSNYLADRIGKADAADHIRQASIYALTDRREQDDSVANVYGKSLLYLVSNAFEEQLGAPLLGMEFFLKKTELPNGLTVHYTRSGSPTDSDSHGGFDNDRATMNDILKTVLGEAYDHRKAFQPHELEGY